MRESLPNRLLVCALAALLGPLQAAEPPSFAEKTQGMKAHEGYFDFYWDAKEGKIWLAIERFDDDFLYVNWLSRGLGSNPVGLDRAQLGGTRVVRFERVGPKILLKEPNLRYRAVTDDRDEVRAVEESFAASVLWGAKVEAEGDGKVLVDATPFLVRDSQGVVERLKSGNEGDYQLDDSRSTVLLDRTRAFPRNSEFEALLTFAGTKPGGNVRETAPTAEAVSLQVHHSFIQLPPAGYQPRKFDPRAGGIPLTFADYAAALDQPIEKRWVRRHRLQKKNPNAAKSEAVEPIVYYLDRGAPEPVRQALLDGARWWNEAFEAAGYTNAFQVELLPDGADPLDVRYNVINWVHRSTRGWSYGASVVDPRTGEILKGVVTLGSLRVRQDRLLFEGLASLSPVDLALARIRQLSAHEVGHTLGFAHNFASSSFGNESVMDYPAPLVQIDDNGDLDFSQAYGVGIGEWDKITVRYAYSDFPDAADEAAELTKIMDEAIDRGMLFISDADARPLGAVHPLASLWDNGADPVAALRQTMEVRRIALEKFGEASIPEGAPMSNLALTLTPLYLHHRYQVEATAKTLGGMEFRYGLRGDSQTATEVVPAARQRDALAALLETLDPKALALPDEILALIPPPAYGYNDQREAFKSRAGRFFDPLAAASVAADITVAVLLEPTRAARLVDIHSRLPEAPSLVEVLRELTKATWLSEQSAVQDQVNETVLRRMISLASNSMAPASVRAIAEGALIELRTRLTERSSDPMSAWGAREIDRFLARPHIEATPAKPLPAPPGSPIGIAR